MSGLIFYMHDGPKTFRFELAGNLAGAEVAKLDQAWRTASSTIRDKILAVDVTFLASSDEKGRDLLLRWWHAGAHFVASSAASRALVESITGRPLPLSDPAVGPTFDPRFTSASLRAALLGIFCAIILLFPPSASAALLPAALPATGGTDQSAAVLERYVATLSEARGLDRVDASVDVEASVPKLEKRARVRAIRRVSEGQRTYQLLASDGDPFVRHEMIARYFTMDSGEKPMAEAISQSNYKFRFVAIKETGASTAYVFHVTPRHKRPGMIEGELWIDTATGLLTHLSGRMVKSPSVLLRRVDISQEMQIRDGVTLARETHLSIKTRFTGRAELTIREREYSAAVSADEVTENVTP